MMEAKVVRSAQIVFENTDQLIAHLVSCGVLRERALDVGRRVDERRAAVA